MADAPAVPHSVLKVRDARPWPGPEPSRDRMWLSMTPFPPSVTPSFTLAAYFWHEPARGHRRPVLHFLPADDTPGLRYCNLWFNSKLGTSSVLDQRPGWRRMDATLTLPPGSDGMVVRGVMETSPDAFADVTLGTVRRTPHGWTFAASEPSPFAEPPANLGAPAIVLAGGAPKSGTTWMQLWLNAHPAILGNGEGAFFGLLAVAPPRFTNQWFPPGMDIHQLTDFAHAAMLRATFGLYRDRLGCPVVADKTPGNSAMAGRMLQALPEARLVHCVRHPLDVLVSRLHHEATFVERDVHAPELAIHRAAVTEVAVPLAAGGTVPIGDGAVWTLARTILDDWTAAQAEALRALTVWPERVWISRYEDMLADPHDTATRVFGFLGVAADPATVAACVAQTSFANVRERTRDKAGDTFFRAGVAGQFEATFTRPDQLRMLDHVRAELPDFDRFGYTAAARRARAA